MWKDRDDGRSAIKTASYEFFDEEELRSIENTDVGEIIDGEEKMKKAIDLAKEYKKNYKRIIDGLKKKVEFPPPLVVKDFSTSSATNSAISESLNELCSSCRNSLKFIILVFRGFSSFFSSFFSSSYLLLA